MSGSPAQSQHQTVLGIETSCDETAAALFSNGEILADRTTRQLLHEKYGGVVPELASRAHEQLLSPAVDSILSESGLDVNDIDAVAVTCGPGLAGALLVGVSFAKGLSAALNIPLIGVNHLEGHLWSAELSGSSIPLPFLGLLISGGHSMTIKVDGFGQYKQIGTTRDDAVGELFDKVGRMLGFNFPSGEDIDSEAMKHFDSHTSDPIRFPRAKLKDDPYGFSFSGLKTAVLYHLKKIYTKTESAYKIPDQDRTEICASMMSSVGDMLINGLTAASKECKFKALVVSGGVSASRYLRKRFKDYTTEHQLKLHIPPIHHCTDNGSMIAYAGYLRLLNGQTNSLDLAVNPAAKLTDRPS